MLTYSPFNRPLGELTTADLSALREVSEGWYVEYKRELPNASSIAKSLSALANTYGGWVFYGVAELSKEEAVAGAFPGIAKAEVDAALQRIRQAASGSINPTPHYVVQVLWGPCEDIGLGSDRGVVCVNVPQGRDAPYVHKSGVIYRRVGDGSEPKPEVDRFFLDQLWRRSQEFRTQYKEWVECDPEFSKGEGERPYVRLLLLTDPWDERVPRGLSVEEIREVLGASTGVVGALPFDTIYASASGFVGRQLRGNDPHNLGITWRLRSAARSEVLIPLPFFDGLKDFAEEIRGYEHAGKFVQRLIAAKYESPRVVDLNYIFNVLLGVVEIQRRINAKIQWQREYFAKVRVLNAWRMVPFLDIPVVLQDFEEHGLPMCLDSVADSPEGLDLDGFQEIPEGDFEGEQSKIIVQALRIFSLIARAFGVPGWVDSKGEAGELPYYEVLQHAGHRAMEVQRLRNERLAHR